MESKTPPKTPSRRSSRRSSRRRRILRRILKTALWLTFLAALLAAGFYVWKQGMVPANQTAEDWYEVQSASESLVQLPRDDAPHDDYMEWWYYNGQLEAKDGDRYSFHFTVFVINALATHSVAHVSFVDQQTGRHYTGQRRTQGNSSKGSKNGFELVIGDWQMTGSNGSDRLRAGTDDFQFNLRLKEGAPPVMQGGTGLLDFELAGKSYYYSRPRMPIKGAVKVGDDTKDVKGVAWFDHQWGDFEVNQLGWDWFALQLDDGADIMIYQLFDSGGLPVLRSATYTRNGVTETLTDERFAVTVTNHWVSAATGIRYPMGWLVEIPERAIEVQVEPVISDSEFDGRITAYMVYWEGAVGVAGTHSGKGFVELSGYSANEESGQPGDP